jgi:hypothetical protein
MDLGETSFNDAENKENCSSMEIGGEAGGRMLHTLDMLAFGLRRTIIWPIAGKTATSNKGIGYAGSIPIWICVLMNRKLEL